MIRMYCLGYKGLQVLNNVKIKSIIGDVVIGNDKAVINDYSKDIEEICVKNRINYCFRGEEKENLEIRYSIAIGWRWILQFREKNVIIIHDSLLPKLRGFNPLVTALINNQQIIGATALFAAEEYDTGPIIAQKKTKIFYPIKIKDAIKTMASVYCELVNYIFKEYEKNGVIEAMCEQNDSNATYSLWRDEYDYVIDWTKSAEYIKRFIDAVGPPYRGAMTYINGEPVRITNSQVVSDVKVENRNVGKVIFKNNDRITVVCGNGLLQIDEIFDDKLMKQVQLKNFRIRFGK